jgi:hypothetical protein
MLDRVMKISSGDAALAAELTNVRAQLAALGPMTMPSSPSADLLSRAAE